MEPGWTLINLNNAFDGVPLHVALIDEQGRYRWIHPRATAYVGADSDTRTVPEGVLIGGNGSLRAALVSWEGEVLWSPDVLMHHHLALDGATDQIWYLPILEDCYAGSVLGTVTVADRGSLAVDWQWRLCDRYTPDPLLATGAHLSCIARFPDEDALLLSSRNQNALFKVDRDSDALVWVMGWAGHPDDGFRGDFAMAEPDRFYQQHEPEIQADGHIVLFDNGMEGAREYSRAIEIAYDEEAMTAAVVWQYRPDPDIFAPIWGDADRLANGNTLIVFGLRSEVAHTYLIEATADGDTVWQVRLPLHWGVYRAERVGAPPLGWVLE
jgi:hypothetical protein